MYPQVSWGIDLATEHERYLAEELFKGPVIVYNYPKVGARPGVARAGGPGTCGVLPRIPYPTY